MKPKNKIKRPPRIDHKPGMSKVWEKRAQEMRDKIKAGQDPREEVKSDNV